MKQKAGFFNKVNKPLVGLTEIQDEITQITTSGMKWNITINSTAMKG